MHGPVLALDIITSANPEPSTVGVYLLCLYGSYFVCYPGLRHQLPSDTHTPGETVEAQAYRFHNSVYGGYRQGDKRHENCDQCAGKNHCSAIHVAIRPVVTKLQPALLSIDTA